MGRTLADYSDAFAGLRRGGTGGHRRPHKPVLLLATISLIESGKASDNRIEYGPGLLELFKHYFDVVKSDNDAVNLMDPFWRLRTDGFFHHHAKPGHEAEVKLLSNAPTLAQLREISDFSTLDDELFAFLQNPSSRDQLREVLVSTYFAEHAPELTRLAMEERGIASYEHFLQDRAADKAREEDEPDTPKSIRKAAFTRVVRAAYDYQCAACGLRVLVGDLAIVDAAHIIPLNISRDNDPRNGMALCKNHHWAMDGNLVAPCPDFKWHVRRDLDDRIAGHRSLMELDGRVILLPKNEKYHPKEKALEWRKTELKKAE